MAIPTVIGAGIIILSSVVVLGAIIAFAISQRGGEDPDVTYYRWLNHITRS